MAPRETFLNQAYHCSEAVLNDGDNIEPEPITEFSQEVASELLSPDNNNSYSESITYYNYYMGVIANEEGKELQETKQQ